MSHISSLQSRLNRIVGLASGACTADGAALLRSEAVAMQADLRNFERELTNIDDQLEQLRTRVQELEREKELIDHVVCHDGAVWRTHEDGDEEGPFCPSCWADHKLHRAEITTVIDGYVRFCCMRHGERFYMFAVAEGLLKGIDLAPYRRPALPKGRPRVVVARWAKTDAAGK